MKPTWLTHFSHYSRVSVLWLPLLISRTDRIEVFNELCIFLRGGFDASEVPESTAILLPALRVIFGVRQTRFLYV